MGIIQKLLDKRPRAKQVAVQEVSGLRHYSALCSTAENVFAQLRPLVDELKMVQPYGVGRNGAKLPLSRTPELVALSNPNEQMGWAEFADLMFSTWLTEKELNIHVWKGQGGRVFGYSVLPVGSRRTVGSRTYFSTCLENGELVELSSDEVMTLRFSRNPRAIDEGVSPGIAALIWSQIDDVLAQYQLGHFENGAVPAYITIIRASTKEKYEQVRKEMEQGFHGAKNKGKNFFLWRAFLPETGEDKDQVEIKTVQGSNASLAIKDIMSIVNDKLNKSFGVSNFILGDDSSAKYDNAELSQQQFLSHRVYPALYCFWDQFQHELDRVTGGLGYAIEFELEIPELTDRLKVKAETKKIEAETANLRVERERLEEQKLKLIEEKKKVQDDAAKVRAETHNTQLTALTSAIGAGATAEAARTALGLGEEWRQAAEEIATRSVAAQLASQPSTEQENTHDHHHDCHHCQHTSDDLPQFSPDEIIERGIYDELIALADALVDGDLGGELALTDAEITALVSRILDRLTEVAEKGVQESQAQIVRSVQNLNWTKPMGQINGKAPETKEELVAVLKSRQEGDVRKLAEDIVRGQMQTRVETIVKNYATEAKQIIREVLNTQGEAKTASQIRAELKEHIPRARAEMIARNETVHAFRLAKLEEAKAEARKYGLKMRKVWVAHDGGCPICEAMDGTTVELDEPFPAEQVDEDGRAYAYEHSVYNEDGATPNAHVNCRCTFEIEVIYG